MHAGCRVAFNKALNTYLLRSMPLFILVEQGRSFRRVYIPQARYTCVRSNMRRSRLRIPDMARADLMLLASISGPFSFFER